MTKQGMYGHAVVKCGIYIYTYCTLYLLIYLSIYLFIYLFFIYQQGEPKKTFSLVNQKNHKKLLSRNYLSLSLYSSLYSFGGSSLRPFSITAWPISHRTLQATQSTDIPLNSWGTQAVRRSGYSSVLDMFQPFLSISYLTCEESIRWCNLIRQCKTYFVSLTWKTEPFGCNQFMTSHATKTYSISGRTTTSWGIGPYRGIASRTNHPLVELLLNPMISRHLPPQKQCKAKIRLNLVLGHCQGNKFHEFPELHEKEKILHQHCQTGPINLPASH